ncbi:MAG: hypothetical protein KGL39_36690 [Patescibacteria group bacterium]|nr:hypothetical protein [Patescibacteria group bacterium]
MNQRLDAKMQDTTATAVTTLGVETVSLPSDIIQLRNASLTSTNPYQSLEYVTPDDFRELFGDTASGQPRIYTNIGATMYLYPKPDAAYTVTFVYKQRVPALSDTNTTNYVLSSYPDVYLYGALANAGPYVIDDRIPQWRSLFQDAVTGINSSDWYSGASMCVKHDRLNA